MKQLYSTTVVLTSGRTGTVSSAAPALDLALSMPPALGGAGGPGTNPEQLFAAGYAACFESSVRFAAQQRALVPAATRVTATARLLRDDATGFQLALDLVVRLEGVAAAVADELVAAARGICPYAKAVSGNVPVTYTVETA